MPESTFVHELTCRSCGAVARFENESPPWKPAEPIPVNMAAFYGPQAAVEMIRPPFEYVECPSCGGKIDRPLWHR